MFKAGDKVQALDMGKWYDAIVIQRLDQELEAYEIHYKGWNKRFDCVKYMKEIRHPQRLITDPLPSPKTKAKLMKNNPINKSLATKVAKKGTHDKTAKKTIKRSAESSPKQKLKKIAKTNTNSKAKKLQDPTVSASTDVAEMLTPNRIEAKVLRSIKIKLKSLGMSPPDQETLDDVRNNFRKEMAAMATGFIDKTIVEITMSKPNKEIRMEPDEDDDVIDWEDLMSQ